MEYSSNRRAGVASLSAEKLFFYVTTLGGCSPQRVQRNAQPPTAKGVATCVDGSAWRPAERKSRKTQDLASRISRQGPEPLSKHPPCGGSWGDSAALAGDRLLNLKESLRLRCFDRQVGRRCRRPQREFAECWRSTSDLGAGQGRWRAAFHASLVSQAWNDFSTRNEATLHSFSSKHYFSPTTSHSHQVTQLTVARSQRRRLFEHSVFCLKSNLARPLNRILLSCRYAGHFSWEAHLWEFDAIFSSSRR